MSTTFTVDFFCSLDRYGSAEGWPGYWGKDGAEIREDVVTAIDRLKRTTDVPMRSHGSITLNRALLAAGLVDPYDAIPESVGLQPRRGMS